jgi:hypothetical protein
LKRFRFHESCKETTIHDSNCAAEVTFQQPYP